MGKEKLSIHAVILAGGRGTRFWPRSRTKTPKQLLNIVGQGTVLEQTVARLRPLISPERIWTVTNSEQASGVRKQLPPGSRARMLVEPSAGIPRRRSHWRPSTFVERPRVTR
jgi:mannose-1-phosphate guanylyltransferase